MTLTDRQQAILDFIRDFSVKTKYPPTIREIGKSVGHFVHFRGELQPQCP